MKVFSKLTYGLVGMLSVGIVYAQCVDFPWDQNTSSGGGSTALPDVNVKKVKVRIQGQKGPFEDKLTVITRQKISIWTEINNKGDANYPNAQIKYFITDDKDFDCDDGFEGEDDDVGTLIPGETETDRKQNVRVPSTPGTYYAYTCVDTVGNPDNAESDLSNNASRDDELEEYAELNVVANLKGYHESASCDFASGWAQDFNKADGGLSVEVWSSNLNGSNSVKKDTISTTHYRSDLGGKHGFYWEIPDEFKDGVPRRLTFRALNHGAGSESYLELPIASGLTGNKIICTPSQGSIVSLNEYWSSSLQCHTWIMEEENLPTINNPDWEFQRIAGYVHNSPQPGTSPIYRAWRNQRYVPAVSGNRVGCHLFTGDSNYEGVGTTDWDQEGIAFHAYLSKYPGTVNTERYFRESTLGHYWTWRDEERPNLQFTHGYGQEIGSA